MKDKSVKMKIKLKLKSKFIKINFILILIVFQFSNLVIPDTYRLDYESFRYIDFIVSIHSAQIIEYSKSYTTMLKNAIFDVSSEDTDDENGVKKAFLNDKLNVNMLDTYVKLTYANIEVCFFIFGRSLNPSF
jgi:hypothetical protein